MARPGLLLYFDVVPALDQLPKAAVGELLLSALHYAQDGREPDFDDPSLGIAWAFLKPIVDRDGAAYDEKQQRGDWLVYCRQCKREGIDSLDFETWRQRTVNGTLRSVDVTLPTTSPSTTTISTPTQKQLQPIDVADMPPAPARDTDGIICISDGDFEQLRLELGERELDRVIDYLGSYCASTGKRYASWPATIRRASREGWGIKGAGQASAPVTDFQPSADRIRENNHWLDQFLAEQAAKEGASNGR